MILNIGILASTKATDMQAVIDSIETKKLNARISVVISNKKDAYALERLKIIILIMRLLILNPKILFLLKTRKREGKHLTKRLLLHWINIKQI